MVGHQPIISIFIHELSFVNRGVVNLGEAGGQDAGLTQMSLRGSDSGIETEKSTEEPIRTICRARLLKFLIFEQAKLAGKRLAFMRGLELRNTQRDMKGFSTEESVLS